MRVEDFCGCRPATRTVTLCEAVFGAFESVTVIFLGAALTGFDIAGFGALVLVGVITVTTSLVVCFLTASIGLPVLVS